MVPFPGMSLILKHVKAVSVKNVINTRFVQCIISRNVFIQIGILSHNVGEDPTL